MRWKTIVIVVLMALAAFAGFRVGSTPGTGPVLSDGHRGGMGDDQALKAPDGSPRPDTEARRAAAVARGWASSSVDRSGAGAETPPWALDYHQRLEHLAELRALADAGWGEAVLPLAEVVSGCISTRDRTPGELFETYFRDLRVRPGATLKEIRAALAPELAESAERQRDWDRFTERLAQEQQRQRHCKHAMPDDPDRLMDWLEMALEQRALGFLNGLIAGHMVVPRHAPWIVRNAERLAAFNEQALRQMRVRIDDGDIELLALAWRPFMRRTLLPELRPDLAWMYAAAAAEIPAGMLDRDFKPEAAFRMIDHDLEHHRMELSGKEAAITRGRELYRQCCADARPR